MLIAFPRIPVRSPTPSQLHSGQGCVPAIISIIFPPFGMHVCLCVYYQQCMHVHTHTLTLIGRSNNPPPKDTCPLQYHAPPLTLFFFNLGIVTDTGSNSDYSFNDLLVPGTMLGFGFAHLTD